MHVLLNVISLSFKDSAVSFTMVLTILKYVLFPILLVFSANSISIPRRDMCASKFPSHLYVVLGERGLLVAENVSISNSSLVDVTSWSHCSVQLVTCSTCVIFIIFRDLDLIQDCIFHDNESDVKCPCDHVWVSEQDKVPRAYFCTGSANPKDLSYQSQTRYLGINFSYNKNHKHPFDIEYIAERNRQYMKGSPGDTNVTFGGVLKSPFFPAYYPRDLGVEYVISCIKSVDHCRIKLIFTDFLISPQSVMEFYDWTGHKLRLTNGIKPRPPVILSSGPSLMIRFLANGGFGLGYKGTYYFVTGDPEPRPLLPITDCGGEVENSGGAITMMNMVRGQNYKYYDCVWLIKPVSNFLNHDLLIYMTVISFANMGPNSEISIYEGQTSEGNLLDIVKPFSIRPRPQYVVSVHSGFYVSLKATFKNLSSLAISYSVFSNLECVRDTEYLCHNNRCISKQLYCDGFDHCGDKSDEPDACFRDWKLDSIDRRWYTHTPNYYFPKSDSYLDLKTATLIFILSSIGLVVLLGTLVFLVYRMGMRTRQQRELHDRLQTITDLFEGAQVTEMDLNDEPPLYEPPPSYDEVMKREKEKMVRQCGAYINLNGGATVRLPDSPPPPYKTDDVKNVADVMNTWAPFSDNIDGAGPSSGPTSSYKPTEEQSAPHRKPFDIKAFFGMKEECDCEGACSCAVLRRGSQPATWSHAITKLGAIDNLLHSIHPKGQSYDPKACVKGSMSADNIFHSQCT